VSGEYADGVAQFEALRQLYRGGRFKAQQWALCIGVQQLICGHRPIRCVHNERDSEVK